MVYKKSSHIVHRYNAKKIHILHLWPSGLSGCLCACVCVCVRVCSYLLHAEHQNTETDILVYFGWSPQGKGSGLGSVWAVGESIMSMKVPTKKEI